MAGSDWRRRHQFDWQSFFARAPAQTFSDAGPEVGFGEIADLLKSFDDYVQHHILTPLKMKDSTLLIKKTNPKLMTWGHERDKDGHVFPSKVYPYNLSDILRERDFGRRGFDSDAVAISWFLGEYRGQATVSHTGSDTGYATFLVLLPEKKIAVVLMADCDWLGKGRGQIAHAALDVALGLKPQPIAVTPSPT